MPTIQERKIARELDRVLNFMTDHGKFIATLRDRITREDPTLYEEGHAASLTSVARKFLGVLRQSFEYSQANQVAFDNALVMMGVEKTGLVADFLAYRNAFRVFRNAAKTNSAQATAALNTLEAALPSADSMTDAQPPTDW